MKFHDFNLFKQQEAVSLYLIVAPEEDDRQRALHFLLKEAKGHIFFSGASITKEKFLEEVETKPFLTDKKLIIIEKVEELDKETINLLQNTLSKSNPWIKWVLTAQKEPTQLISLVDEFGIILSFSKQEKPWEKEKRVSEWVGLYMKENGVSISNATAQMLVQAVEPENLENELEKLICFVGKRREITQKDITLVSLKKRNESLFQLTDAIFERKLSHALQIGRSLLEEGHDIFLLLAQLRSQIQMGSGVLRAHSEGGNAAITKAFPFLKGGFLDKKLRIFQSYGASRLKRGEFLIFEAEIKAKNFKFSDIIFETLIAKLSDDALFAS